MCWATYGMVVARRRHSGTLEVCASGILRSNLPRRQLELAMPRAARICLRRAVDPQNHQDGSSRRRVMASFEDNGRGNMAPLPADAAVAAHREPIIQLVVVK